MASFEIKGGHPLRGEIVPQGAKNEALQVLSAVLLTRDKVRIEHVPDIRDINKLIELLGLLGVKVSHIEADDCESGRTFEFEARDIDLDVLQSPAYREQAGALRGSIMLAGPLLARFGRAVVPQVLSNFASYALLRFEINVRGASIMGFVGAGGIGQDLIEAIRKFYFTDVSAILLLIIVTVMLIDYGTERLRHALLSLEHGK